MRLPAACVALSILSFAFGALPAADAPPAELPMMAKLTKVTPEIEKKITEACPTSGTVTPQKPRKVLIFSRAEGFVHGSISVAEKALIILGKTSGAYTAEATYDYAVFDAATLAGYDAIVFNNSTGTKIPEGAPRQALLDFVRGGKGVVGVHAGVDNFKNFPEALAMMGGVFAGHPWGAGGTWRFKVEDAKNPLTASLDPAGFSLKDEIYQYDQKITNRGNIRPLVTLDLGDAKTGEAGKGVDKDGKPKNGQIRTDGDNPVVWVRPEGKGRVFHCGFGHNNEVFWDPAILKLYLAGIQYAVGDLPLDDKPVPAAK